MTITYGLTATGYLPKTQDICRSEMTASLQKLRGTSVDCSDGSLEGQWIGIFSEREATLWDLGQVLYSAIDVDAASGAAEDALCAITGTLRALARSSVVTETLTGTPATSVGAGSQIKTTSTGALFATTTTAVIATLSAWAPTTAYSVARNGTTVGNRVTNAARAYECITAGTSAGSGGPTTTAVDITDGTVHWRYLGEGTGAVDVPTTSVTKAAITAANGDINIIMTPVGGWQSAINVLDATVGALTQTDANLRITREAEIAQAGSSPADAILAAILRVTGVTSCTVYHNDTDTTDVNGQPPHTVQALVQGGADADIAAVLLANVAAGINTYGGSSGGTLVTVVVNDSQGTPQTINFTRPGTLTIYVDITYTYNPATPARGGYPTNGDAAAQLAIATMGNAQGAGKDVVASSTGAAVFPIFANGALIAGVQGVLDVTSTKIGTAPSPTLSTTIVVTPFQLASFDTSRVTIHSSAGSY